MKVQGKMFLWLAAFILVMGIVYGVWSKEPAGTTALFMGSGLSAYDTWGTVARHAILVHSACLAGQMQPLCCRRVGSGRQYLLVDRPPW